MKATWSNGGIDLYQGDCLDVLPTLASDSVDLVVTDPPYGHGNNDGDLIHNREKALGAPVKSLKRPEAARPILNDGEEANEVFGRVLPELRRVLMPGCCCCCCCCGGGPDPQFARWSMWLDEVFDFKQMVVWDKGPMGMGWHYRRSYETILVVTKPGAACRWYDKTKGIENIIRPGQYGISKIIPSKADHPTAKPVHLAKHFIRLHSEEGHLVLDSFMGAGWVAAACVRTRRRFIGIELDPQWFDRAVKVVEHEQAKLAKEA